MRRRRFLGLLLIASLALSAAQGCRDDPSNFNEYDNFVAATKRADSEGWKPYWLGRSFTAGQLTFDGPRVGEFGYEIEGGGTVYKYHSALASGSVGLDVYIYSSQAWMAAESIGRTRRPPGATIRDVKLAGHDATLSVSKDSRGFVDQVRADIEIDGIMVRAHAGRATPLTGDVDLNPLTDEATFLAVMQNLRPYPE